MTEGGDRDPGSAWKQGRSAKSGGTTALSVLSHGSSSGTSTLAASLGMMVGMASGLTRVVGRDQRCSFRRPLR